MLDDLSKEFNPGTTKEPPEVTATAVQNRIVTEDPEPQEIPNQENSIDDQELKPNQENSIDDQELNVNLLVMYQM